MSIVAPEVNSCIIRQMTCCAEAHCPKCDSKEIKKAGFNTCGVQRYFCRNVSCDVNIFNTLKNQGYHFEHNFSHGYKHLFYGFRFFDVTIVFNRPNSATLLLSISSSSP